MSDYAKMIRIIADTIAKCGEPLSETQFLAMAGSVSVLLNKELAAKDAEIEYGKKRAEYLLAQGNDALERAMNAERQRDKLLAEREELEKQEPVDYVGEDDMGNKIALLSDDTPIGMPLYAHPVPAVPEWLPIETAPKDGTPLLVYDGYAITTAFYNVNYDWWEICVPSDGFVDSNCIAPTRWMPLPAAPQNGKEKE